MGRRRGRRSTGRPSPRMAQLKPEAAASELDGSGEVEDGAAEGAETLPYFSMYRAMIAFSVGVPVYDAFCSAPVSCGKTSACPGRPP